MSADDDGDFIVVSASTASRFVAVRIYDETVFEHIPTHHPEIKLAGSELGSQLIRPAIEEALTSPTKIFDSATSTESQVFVCENLTFQGNSLVVPVKAVDGTTDGRVQTAYFANDFSGTLVWSADNE